MSSKKLNMEVFLLEIISQFIAIKDADYAASLAIFQEVFRQVKGHMSAADNYFGKYSSEVVIAGSVSDNIKVGKLDEFDVNVVVRLPISYEDIELEHHKPGYVKLRIAEALDHLDKQPEWERCHRVTREWRDGSKYLLQSKFRGWMHATVQKAINAMGGRVEVAGAVYSLAYRHTGPAFTLHIVRGDFRLDVDLVPAIRFGLPRWPPRYRRADAAGAGAGAGAEHHKWYVVPKPLKSTEADVIKHRCWRLAFHDFEREIIKGHFNLKPTIRMVKKLRDSLAMKEIASYYIKTLFMWEIDRRRALAGGEHNDKYWRNKFTVLFRDMVGVLLAAIQDKRIRYYWHSDYNLLEALKDSHRDIYSKQLKEVLRQLEANDVEGVCASLLTRGELGEFRRSEFYRRAAGSDAVTVSQQKPVEPSCPRQVPAVQSVPATQSVPAVQGESSCSVV